MKLTLLTRRRKFVFFFLCLAMFLVAFISAKKQPEEILAADETTRSRLLCGEEIPSGEAMEKTADLLFLLLKNFSVINANIDTQIAATQEMNRLTERCDVNVCESVDCGSYDCSWDEKTVCPPGQTPPCYIHHPEDCCNEPPPACTSPWKWEGEFQACPRAEIEAQYKIIEEANKKIENAKKEIWALIGGTDNNPLPAVDRMESLCDTMNSDIRTSANQQCCLLSPDLCKITRVEAIARKLSKARREFDKCYIPASDWEKVAKRELPGKVLMSCDLVLNEDLPRSTKTTVEIKNKETPICTSLHNWFCCQ